MYDDVAPEFEGNTVALPWNQFGVVPTGELKFCSAQPAEGRVVISSKL